jgi:hypothetical protein
VHRLDLEGDAVPREPAAQVDTICEKGPWLIFLSQNYEMSNATTYCKEVTFPKVWTKLEHCKGYNQVVGSTWNTLMDWIASMERERQSQSRTAWS